MSGEAVLSTQMRQKPFGGRGFAMDPTGGAYSAPLTPSWWGGGSLPPPKNPISALGPSSLDPRPFGPRTCPPNPEGWLTPLLLVLCFAVSLTFFYYFMVSNQQESAQFFKIRSCQVAFVWRLECAYHCLMAPRATIRKPACVECLYSEPRLLGVHPKQILGYAIVRGPGPLAPVTRALDAGREISLTNFSSPVGPSVCLSVCCFRLHDLSVYSLCVFVLLRSVRLTIIPLSRLVLA